MSFEKKIREFKYRLFSWKTYPELAPSKQPIDVVIPTIEKDLLSLPICLEGIKNCVNHPIENIYIVAPENETIRQFCKDNGLIFIEETSVLGFGPKDIDLKIDFGNGTIKNRSGWIFQQFIKLSGKIGTCSHYLCIDSDHVLIHPHTFLTEDGTTVFYLSYELHKPYYDNIHRLMPELELERFSFVDHKMLFSKSILKELHQALEQKSGKDWIHTILDSLDRSTESGFSEFELYGNFTKRKILRPWLQKRLPYKKMADFKTLQKKYGNSRWTLTFPDYMRQNQNIDRTKPLTQ